MAVAAPKRSPSPPPPQAVKRSREAENEGDKSSSFSLHPGGFYPFPLDLLPLVFRHVTVRACLTVISFVSRRWRSLALQSVDHVRANCDNAPRVMGLFSRITTLDLMGACAPILVPPPDLQHLTISSVGWESLCALRCFAHLSSLRSISVQWHCHCTSLTALILNSRETLTSIEITDKPSSMPEQALTALLRKIHFPALSSVNIHFDFNDLQPLLAMHASQLTELDLTKSKAGALRGALPNWMLDLQLPRMRHLALAPGSSSLSSVAMIKSARSLQSLHLNCTSVMLASLVGVAASLLTTLQLSEWAMYDPEKYVDVVAFAESLSQCTHLTDLRVAPHVSPVTLMSLFATTTTQSFSSRLLRLTIEDNEPNSWERQPLPPVHTNLTDVLTACPRLEYLSVHAARSRNGLTLALPHCFKLNRLVELHISMDSMPFATAMYDINALAARCPNLRVIVANVGRIRDTDLDLRNSTTSLVKRRGVEQFKIVPISPMLH